MTKNGKVGLGWVGQERRGETRFREGVVDSRTGRNGCTARSVPSVCDARRQRPWRGLNDTCRPPCFDPLQALCH